MAVLEGAEAGPPHLAPLIRSNPVVVHGQMCSDKAGNVAGRDTGSTTVAPVDWLAAVVGDGKDVDPFLVGPGR
jgi:hypothetical protein